jgi:hypothetical protein
MASTLSVEEVCDGNAHIGGKKSRTHSDGWTISGFVRKTAFAGSTSSKRPILTSVGCGEISSRKFSQSLKWHTTRFTPTMRLIAGITGIFDCGLKGHPSSPVRKANLLTGWLFYYGLSPGDAFAQKTDRYRRPPAFVSDRKLCK